MFNALAVIHREWVWTAPNLITLLRLVIALLGLNVFYWWSYQPWYMCVLLGLACALDYADGWLARTLNQTSLSGKILDPLVDKVTMWNAVLIIAHWAATSAGQSHWVWVICAPLIVIIALYDYMTMSMRSVDEKMVTNAAAKEKQVLLFIAIGLFILSIAFDHAAKQEPEVFALRMTQVVLMLLGILMLSFAVRKAAKSARIYLKTAGEAAKRKLGGRQWIASILRAIP